MMRRPQRMGSRANALDRVIHRFQDRWETDRQFRAMLSGVSGLVMVVALCACMGVVTTVANSTLAGVSAARNTNNAPQNNNTGTGQIQAQPTFPTATVPPWPQSGPPTYSIIPSSQTPVPSATVRATATPTATATVGGGGPGGLPTTCQGSQGGSAWQLQPCPQLAGKAGTLIISAPKYPNAALNIVIGFGSCNNCGIDYPPGTYSLDASGNASIGYTVPAGAANSTVPISGMINIGGGPTLGIQAAPVQ
ncbi:MAG: hypothetical protein ACM3N4_03435 [Nitrososphaerota archaeon]